ncbi:MAG: protease modulator HflC [Oscillospiraceae bacterium]|nr:protease modulator HflC [Oscillospiraceae bacterium]
MDDIYVDNVRKKPDRPARGRWILIAAAVLAALLLALSSMYFLEENHYGYVTRFSKMVSIEDRPGLHFKAPFIDSARQIPVCLMVYDIPASDVLTKDKKALVIDEFCIWRIMDPYQYVRSLNASKAEAEARIDAAVYSAVKNEFGRLNREEIISTDQSSVRQVSERVTQQVDSALGSYGITCTVILKKTDLPSENQSAVFERMIAERQLQSTSYLSNGELEGNRIRNDVDKQVEIIIAEATAAAERRSGEAEAEYMRILSEAYNDPEKAEFYRFVREIDAMKASFESGGSTTLILDGDSEIARALLGQ